MNWLCWHRRDLDDFSKYLPDGPASNKEKLIVECRKRCVPIYVTDQSETTSGPYAALRAVAPESELHARLLQAILAERARNANRIAWLALLVSVVSLIVTIVR
jgi:hypothetical protein